MSAVFLAAQNEYPETVMALVGAGARLELVLHRPMNRPYFSNFPISYSLIWMPKSASGDLV